VKSPMVVEPLRRTTPRPPVVHRCYKHGCRMFLDRDDPPLLHCPICDTNWDES